MLYKYVNNYLKKNLKRQMMSEEYKIRYGSGGVMYKEKIKKVEPEKKSEEKPKKKKKKVIQEIMGDDLKEQREMLDEII